MKKILLILPLLFFSQHAHAAYLLYNVNWNGASASSISSTTPPNTIGPYTFGYADISKVTSTEPQGADTRVNGTLWWSSSASTNVDLSTTMVGADPGEYSFFSISGSQYCFFTWNGSTANLGTCGLSGGVDGNFSTHVIRITAPALYSIASTSFSVNFDIYGASSSPPNGYDMTFTNQLTRQTYTRSGWLVDSGYSSSYYDNAFTVATSTYIPTDGTYSLTITLWNGGNGGPDPDPAGTTYAYFNPGLVTAFSVNVQDNVQTVRFDGPAQQTFASTSCAVNFLGTFNFQDCVGYLVTPSTASGSPLSNLKSITLAHSFPFSYAYEAPDLAKALFNATNTASTSIGVAVPWLGSTTTITFLSAAMIQAVPYTPWIKSTLSALMLLMTALLIYRKILASHNTNAV